MATERATIVNAVETLLKTVAGIGQVHKYIRAVHDQDKFEELFTQLVTGSTKIRQVNAWLITVDAITENRAGPNTATNQGMRSYRVAVGGYIGLKDNIGSEEIFLDLIETILNAFNVHIQLGIVTLAQGMYAYPLSSTLIGHREFGNVLCHYCQLQTTVEVRKSYNFVV